MKQTAKGEFNVNLAPQVLADTDADASMGRLSLDKQFHGDLDARSKGEMLSARSSVQGSAGYVAIERVTGTLHGRSGSFVLQHSGTMDRGTATLSVNVVSDSGTDELVGLIGSMAIDIRDGKHYYMFEYTLPD